MHPATRAVRQKQKRLKKKQWEEMKKLPALEFFREQKRYYQFSYTKNKNNDTALMKGHKYDYSNVIEICKTAKTRRRGNRQILASSYLKDIDPLFDDGKAWTTDWIF